MNINQNILYSQSIDSSLIGEMGEPSVQQRREVEEACACRVCSKTVSFVLPTTPDALVQTDCTSWFKDERAGLKCRVMQKGVYLEVLLASHLGHIH